MKMFMVIHYFSDSYHNITIIDQISDLKSVIMKLYKTKLLSNSFFPYVNRLRNDGSFITKANNCAIVATIRELPSSKENRSNNNKYNNNRYNNSDIKSSQATARMTETCDRHKLRHRAPLPPVEVSFLFDFNTYYWNISY